MQEPDRADSVHALTVQELDKRLRQTVFNAWLGLRLKTMDDDGITLEMPWRPEFASNPEKGYAHGGVIAALLDAATFFALFAKLGHGSPTADLHIDYLRSAPQGPLEARARVVKLGRQLSVAEAQVTRPDGKLVATGRAALLSGSPVS